MGTRNHDTRLQTKRSRQISNSGGWQGTNQTDIYTGCCKAGLKRRGQRLAELQPFTHALEDEDVRVDRHGEGQHDAGDLAPVQRRRGHQDPDPSEV